MGHSIDAIVGLNPIDEDKAREWGFALIYESDFVIIPLIEENIHHFEIENKIKSEKFGNEVDWACTTTIEIANILGLKKHVIATLRNPDFLGSYYEGSIKLNHEVDINSALSYLGVPKKNNSEFDYLNLDEYRNFEFYYMNKIVGHSDTSNMIKGKILHPNWDKKE